MLGGRCGAALARPAPAATCRKRRRAIRWLSISHASVSSVSLGSRTASRLRTCNWFGDLQFRGKRHPTLLHLWIAGLPFPGCLDRGGECFLQVTPASRIWEFLPQALQHPHCLVHGCDSIITIAPRGFHSRKLFECHCRPALIFGFIRIPRR